MAETLSYILNLEGNLQEKLKKINIANDQQLETWAKVQSQVVKATGTMDNMGKSLGSMREKVVALKAQKEWIPANNRKAIRTTNLEVKKLEKEIRKLESLNGGRLKSWFTNLKQGIPILNMITNPIALATVGLYKFYGTLQKSQEAYNKQAIAETQLTAVMRNTMGARKEDVNSILELASAQQKLGIIGDEVQLAGAQELSTYLTKTDSLKKLMPIMNDMMAQQYGLNASQEQASQIASMLGKVMDGQTGALSRYGYKFDEAQEKILKTGTEAQRAAVLFDVVNASVGGVNQALAQTPEGKLKQQANEAGDLQERLGKLFVSVKTAFTPLTEFINKAVGGLISFFEKNESKIKSFAAVVSQTLIKSFRILSAIMEAVIYVFQEFGVAIGAVVGAIAVYKLGIITVTALTKTWAVVTSAFKIVVTTITSATKMWAIATGILNAVLSLNPIGLIIIAVVALIAVIAFLVIKVDGWGKTWSNVVEFCTIAFEGFKSAVTLAWLHIQDTFISGIEIIEEGWYRLQSLWDKDTANKGLENLQSQRDARADAIAEQKKVSDALKEKLSTMKVFELSLNDTSLSDVTAGIKSKLGIEDPRIPGADFNLGSGDSFGGNSVGDETASAIATGGSKTTHITINLGQLVEQINIAKDGFREGAVEMRDMILDELTRVLSMAQGQV